MINNGKHQVYKNLWEFSLLESRNPHLHNGMKNGCSRENNDCTHLDNVNNVLTGCNRSLIFCKMAVEYTKKKMEDSSD